MNLLNDIYYQKSYAELYQTENSEVFDFRYEKGTFTFANIAIKKPIKEIAGQSIDEAYFDLETAYGYGGIWSNTEDLDFLNEAFNAYQAECLSQGIIADFSRIHPFNHTHLHLKDKYSLHVKDRNTVVVDLEMSTEKRWEGYSSKLRNILRKCNRELSIRKSEDLDKFIDLYNQTMIKNNATEFYFFKKNYFESLLALDKVELFEVLYEDQVVSATFVMFGEDIAHYHLSANDYAFRKHNANYYILDSLFDIAQKKGIKNFYLGGGRTNQEDDSLLRFKRKFSPLLKEFYIAGIVHNKEVYDKYVKLWESNSEEEVKYFLKYRITS